MNNIRQIQGLNKLELETGVSSNASWHADYRDTAYIYIGGLPFELSEGDIITIFSQFGEPTYVNLIRDKETGKSKGFAFLKYEDQRSTDLAVDNLGGAKILNRIIRVDHTRYRRKENELEDDQGWVEPSNILEAMEDVTRPKDIDGTTGSERPKLKEEQELAVLITDHDDDDPMKSFLIQEKKKAVSAALAQFNDGITSKSDKGGKRHHHHHHHHHSHRIRGLDEREYGKRYSQPRGEDRLGRSHSKDIRD